MMIVNEPELAKFSVRVVPKVWGCEYWLTNTNRYCLKLLKVNPGFQCSVHMHKKKDETFIGVMGTVQLNIHTAEGGIFDTIGIDSGRKYQIVPGVFHSFQAANVSWIMEVSSHHDDNDVTRLQESRKL